MKKRSMHRLHIGDDVWKWYVKSWRGGKTIIFAPTGKRYEIGMGDCAITPSQVKEYIINNLKKQDESWARCRSH
jgi:hypothetical protein